MAGIEPASYNISKNDHRLILDQTYKIIFQGTANPHPGIARKYFLIRNSGIFDLRL